MFCRNLRLTNSWVAAVLLLAASSAVVAGPPRTGTGGGKNCPPYCSPTFGYHPTYWRPWPRICDVPHDAVLPPNNVPVKPAEPPGELLPLPKLEGSRKAPSPPSKPSVFPAVYSPATVPPAYGAGRPTPYVPTGIPPAVKTSPQPPRR